MKDRKEYIIPEDLKPGQLPHALAWYDEKKLVEDWIEEHPKDSLNDCIVGILTLTHGRCNPATLANFYRFYKSGTI